MKSQFCFFAFLASFSLIIFGCPGKDDDAFVPPPGPCDEVTCLNGGTCNEGACECEWPYLGEECRLHVFDAIGGTYAFSYSDGAIQYVVTVFADVLTRRIRIKNLENNGVTVEGTMDASGQVNFETVPTRDIYCAAPTETTVALEAVEEEGDILEVYVWITQESCQGNSGPFFSGGPLTLERIRSGRCEQSYYQQDCDINLGVAAAGTYVFDQERSTLSIIGFDVHTLTVSPGTSHTNLKVENLLNSGRTASLVALGFNQFELASSSHQYSLNNSGLTYPSQEYHRAYLTPDGEYLLFEAAFVSTVTGDYSFSGTIAYKRL